MTNQTEISLITSQIDDNSTIITDTIEFDCHIPKDLFSCLICYETFGIDQQQQLVALKCGHMFCASCIHQWFTANKVCPTCRKRCWLKDILYIDVSTCIVMYGKKKIDNLSAERDRLKHDIQTLREAIKTTRQSVRKIKYRFKTKQRLLNRLNYICKQNSRKLK
ncbi:hypothetical protein I4U23_025437 [Adineta vaga]|nr:hypothetical protein I4U23_025437 [Adineta vaga]